MKEAIFGVIFHPVTGTIIMALLGVAFAGFKKYKRVFKEIMDIGRKYDAITDEKSPGGKEITTDEWAAIGKEVVEVIEAGAPLFKKSKGA